MEEKWVVRSPDVGRVIWSLVVMALDEVDIIFDSSWSLVSIPTNTHGNVCSLCHLAIVTHIYILCLAG